MSDFKLSLGVEVQTGDIPGQINAATNNLDPIKLDVELGNVKSLNAELKNIGTSAGNIISNSAQKSINKVSSKMIGSAFRVTKDDSQEFENQMNSLVRKWTNGKGNLVDIQVETKTRYDSDAQANIEELSKAHVTYKNAANESIKKTLEWRKISDADGEDVMGWVESSAKYAKSMEKTQTQAEKFAKQQKKSASDLTNQINQLNRSATDQNANRPIKEQDHLDALSNKYTEITDAITRMRSASSSTFDDEQNNVKTLISEYKSMVSEFRNAENVAGKLAGNDYESGRQIAEQSLEKLKAKAANYDEMTETVNKLQTAFEGVNDAASLKDFNSQLRVANAELDTVKTKVAETNRAEKVGINVSGLQSKIADLQKISPEIDQFETKIDGADVSVQSLLSDLSQVKTQGDFSVVNAKFNAFTEAAKTAGIAVTETVTNMKSVTDIQNKLSDTGYDGFTEEVKRAHTEANKLKTSSEGLQSALTRLDTAMDGISAADEAGDMKALVAANEEYEAALKQVYSQIKLNQQAEKDAYNVDKLELSKESALLKLDSLFESGSQAARKYGADLQQLQNEIIECSSLSGMDTINKKVSNLSQTVKNSGLQTQTLGSQIKAQLSKYSQYLSVAQVIMYATQGLKDMFNQVVAIDSAMTELKKVTNETDESYDQFLSNAASKSKEIGTTIDGLVSSTADFARLGYDFEQSAGLAEVANIYTVVGDEIDSVDTATQSLVSTLAAFKHEMGDMSDSDFAMSIVDKFNEVSNNFAISSGGIGEALQRSASSLAAANTTLDESIALITAANTVVQNPEKVGKLAMPT